MKVSVKFFRSPAYIKRKKQKQNEPLSRSRKAMGRQRRGDLKMNGERERVQGNKKSSIKEDPFRSQRHIGRAMVGKVVEGEKEKEEWKKEEVR